MPRLGGYLLALVWLPAAILLGLLAPVYGEEGCPHGSFPQEVDGKCIKVSFYNRLPLTLDAAMRFEALQVGTTTWLQATGTITEETPEELEKFLKTDDAQSVHRIELSSPGGSLMAGLELGRIIRRAGMSTSIGRSIPLDGVMNVYSYKRSLCASACAYAFLGGVTRSYEPNDLYGLHRFGKPSGTVSGDEAQIVTSAVAKYIESMGVDVAMLKLASSASFSHDIYSVPVDLAKKLRIIFDPSGVVEFVVERLGRLTVASFELKNKGVSYGGFVACSNGSPVIVLIDLDNSIPGPLREAVDFPVVFKSEFGPLRGSATYVAETTGRGGAPALIFRVPGLRPNVFHGRGLSLENFDNPHLPTIKQRSDGSAVIDDSMVRRFAWIDAELSFQFGISASNAERTLPIVLDKCN